VSVARPQYEVIRPLGSGSEGFVDLVKDESGAFFVRKQRTVGTTEELDAALREAYHTSCITSPFCVKYVDIVTEEKLVGLILQYYPHGDLAAYLAQCARLDAQGLNEEAIRSIVYELTQVDNRIKRFLCHCSYIMFVH
jgi:serine/threonine protein kinase